MINTVQLTKFEENNLPENIGNLIIADPPYYKVKGEFDFIFKNFEEYLEAVEVWALECKRLLKDNGVLIWYGSSKKIAYTQVILDKYFSLINNAVWNKGSFMGLEESTGIRSLAPCTERVLIYEAKGEKTNSELILDKYLKPRNPFSIYLKEEFKRANVTAKEISKLFPSKNGNLTGCVSNWLNGNNVITAIQYAKIREYLGGDYLSREYFELLKLYTDLQDEVEKMRRPFNNEFQLQEILNFSNEQNQTGSLYDHDTVKPETLTRALILTFSNEGDTVIVPFAGSGTECAMAATEKRPFYACEISEYYKNMAQDRADNQLNNPKLF